MHEQNVKKGRKPNQYGDVWNKWSSESQFIEFMPTELVPPKKQKTFFDKLKELF